MRNEHECPAPSIMAPDSDIWAVSIHGRQIQFRVLEGRLFLNGREQGAVIDATEGRIDFSSTTPPELRFQVAAAAIGSLVEGL